MTRTRGFALLYALVAIVLVSSVAVVLTAHVGFGFQQAHQERLKTQARQLVDSGLAYANVHFSDWLSDAPTAPIELPAGALLPAGATGKVVVTVEPAASSMQILVEAEVRRGGHQAHDRWEVAWIAPPKD